MNPQLELFAYMIWTFILPPLVGLIWLYLSSFEINIKRIINKIKTHGLQ